MITIKPVHTTNNVEAILSNATKSNVVSTKSNVASTMLPKRATMSQQLATKLPVALTMLLRHCCWCGPGFTAQLTSSRLVVPRSLLMAPTAFNARCAMSLQLYTRTNAGSGIERGSCWNCSLGWHAICLRYSTTVDQHYNRYRVSRGCVSDSWASCWAIVWKNRQTHRPYSVGVGQYHRIIANLITTWLGGQKLVWLINASTYRPLLADPLAAENIDN